MEISFHSHLESNTVIATKFCTWHYSCAVVACAKNCFDLMASNAITARRIFHRIWIAGKKSLVKRAPAGSYYWLIYIKYTFIFSMGEWLQHVKHFKYKDINPTNNDWWSAISYTNQPLSSPHVTGIVLNTIARPFKQVKGTMAFREQYILWFSWIKC